MWERYKKTWIGMQLFIAAVSVAAYLLFGHVLAHAGAFFIVMQMGALVGAAWSARLCAMARRQAEQIPLRAPR